MATWVAHFHIAQAILEIGFDFNRAMFLVGNIAPDSGTIDKENLLYTPDKNTSHWRNAENIIEPDRFYAKHLTQPILDTSEYAFLMGFYCHLIADREWSETVWKPKLETALYSEPLKEDKQFIWEIKKDWYGLDFLYLQEHQTSVFYTDFIQIEAVPDYLPAFPKGAFTDRVRDTKAYYLDGPEWDLDRPYIYLNRSEWNDYVNHTIHITKTTLQDKLNK